MIVVMLSLVFIMIVGASLVFASCMGQIPNGQIGDKPVGRKLGIIGAVIGLSSLAILLVCYGVGTFAGIV